MNKFSNKLKITCFCPILGSFSQFFEQTKFSWKIQLFNAQLRMGFQHHAKNLGKVNDTIQRKRPDRQDGWNDGWKDKRKDRQTLFYRTLPTTARGPRMMATLIFDHAHPNIFQSTSIFYESLSIWKKSSFFIILFQRYSQFKNTAI